MERLNSEDPEVAGQDHSDVERGIRQLSGRSTAVLNRDPRSPLSQFTSQEVLDFTHPLTHEKTAIDVVVGFDGDEDPYRAINWPLKKKAYSTLLYGLTTMGATWASAIFASAIPKVSNDFHVLPVVSTLGTTLFMLGFGTGPLLWAPLSEVYGRRLAVFVPYFIGACFSFGTATAKDLQTIFITRFFTGFFASAPVTNTGGVLADLFSPDQRAIAMAGYSMATVGGPLLGPIVGGAIVNSKISWRWTEFITGMMMLAFLFLDILVLDESYSATLLVFKARRLRLASGNWALHAKHEEWDVTLTEMAHKYLVRPFQLVATPICLAMSSYAAFVYALVYLCLSAFPLEYEVERGWNPLVGSLPFISILLGCFLGAAINTINAKFYSKRFKANGNRAIPEARLPPMMLGAIIFPAGLFIFAWTSNKDISWIGSCFGGLLIGCGVLTIFQAALNYIIDTFSQYASSAVAATTALRSILAGVFPLFATFMFNGLGLEWGFSLLGFVSLALMPIPFLFYKYGRLLRSKGKWSKNSC